MAGKTSEDLFLQGFRIEWDRLTDDFWLEDIPAFSGLSEMRFERHITIFCGENGTGKSTLLEALAVASGFNGEGGTANYNFSTASDVSSLNDALVLYKGFRRKGDGYFFRAESFFNVATVAKQEYDLQDYHLKSHGESFLDFLQRYGKDGLYLMDEPEAALSPQRQMTLLIYIYEKAKAGSQFIIATHSPILLGIPGAQLLEFSEEGIQPVEWEDTESVTAMRNFINHRERMLQMLLEEE